MNWIYNRYGSKRGLFNTNYHRVLNLMGRYKYCEIDWSGINRLVFVCKGNICRSPFAEAVARSLNIEADSCGLSTIEDSPANLTAIKVAEELGYDLNAHRTKPIMYCDLKKTDCLITMEPWHAILLNKYSNMSYNVTLLGMWGSPITPYIHDPYETSRKYYSRCFEYIEKTVHDISGKI